MKTPPAYLSWVSLWIFESNKCRGNCNHCHMAIRQHQPSVLPVQSTPWVSGPGPGPQATRKKTASWANRMEWVILYHRETNNLFHIACFYSQIPTSHNYGIFKILGMTWKANCFPSRMLFSTPVRSDRFWVRRLKDGIENHQQVVHGKCKGCHLKPAGIGMNHPPSPRF